MSYNLLTQHCFPIVSNKLFNIPYHIHISMLITSSVILIFLIAYLPHSLPKTAVQSQINQIINQVLILPNHIPHRSQHIHIPHPKDCPLVTTQSPPVEVFNKSFTWLKKKQQFNKAVINTSSLPSSTSTNTYNHASDTHPMESTLPFPITESNIPSPQISFTNLSSLNIKDNSLYHPLRHQQGIWTPSRLKKYYPLYLNIPAITQLIHHSSPD